MDVRLREGGAPKGISPKHLRKVCMKEKEALGEDGYRVLEIFQTYDLDGDGMIDTFELEEMCKALGMGDILGRFLHGCDKNQDGQILYEEFLEWALSPVSAERN